MVEVAPEADEEYDPVKELVARLESTDGSTQEVNPVLADLKTDANLPLRDAVLHAYLLRADFNVERSIAALQFEIERTSLRFFHE